MMMIIIVVIIIIDDDDYDAGDYVYGDDTHGDDHNSINIAILNWAWTCLVHFSWTHPNGWQITAPSCKLVYKRM